MLGQADIAKYFDMCDGDPDAIDEVLRAYVSWKIVKGSSNGRVVLKIHYLQMFLQASGRMNVLRNGRKSFKAIVAELKMGECRGISSEAACTPAGKQAFNALRRCPRYKAYFLKAQHDTPSTRSAPTPGTFDPLDWSLLNAGLRHHPAHRCSANTEEELRRVYVDEDEQGQVPPEYTVRATPGTTRVSPLSGRSQVQGPAPPDYVP